MKLKNVLNAVEKFGVGEQKKLTKSQLLSLEHVCNGLRDELIDSCTSHAPYRGTLTSDGDKVYLVMSGADIDGTLREVEICVDIETKELYTRDIEFSKGNKVASEMYNLVVKLMETIPVTVGMLDIPIEGEFKQGVLMEYSLERGTALICIKDSLKNDFFTS